jgi:osmotically inducible protein OsmC
MIKNAWAVWQGSIKEGGGTISTETGVLKEAPYGFKSRFENGKGTNPEELIGAAHAGCFSMALSNALAQAGHTATSVKTTAKVHLEKGAEGFGISKIDLETVGDVPGLDEGEFLKYAEGAKANCPVSKALAAVEITLSARLA